MSVLIYLIHSLFLLITHIKKRGIWGMVIGMVMRIIPISKRTRRSGPVRPYSLGLVPLRVMARS